jgi:acyl-CoA reductase-like NAD-dependent aldehyde dehydrogenase
MAPAIFDHCTDAMKIVREEIFGPVVCERYRALSLESGKRALKQKLMLGLHFAV